MEQPAASTGQLDFASTRISASSTSRRSAASSPAMPRRCGGGPVKAMLIQNTNPVNVAPEQRLVKQGFARDDLFVAVHEQFMTETAEMADIVLPATMFVEHDDIYRAGGQNHILLGPKLVEPPETSAPISSSSRNWPSASASPTCPGFG
jgi:anaerobic selenocysteine-containing dehydrogenase